MEDSPFILDAKKLTITPLLETLLDMTHHGICVIRAQGDIVVANEQIIGWTGHVNLRHLNQLWDYKDLIQIQKQLQINLLRRPALHLSLQCSNGVMIPVNVRIQHFIEDDCLLYVLILADLRKERQWESTLASTQEQHLHFLYAVSAAVCIVRQDTGEILTSNEPFASWYGLPSDSLRGQLISEFFPDPQTWTDLCSRLDRQTTSGTETQVSTYHPEQGRGWAKVLAHRIHFDGYEAIILSIEDITQFREQQRALEEATQLLKAVVTTQSQFVSDIDPETLFQHILDHIFSMSYCRFGFIASLDQHQGLQIQAFNNKDWNFDTVDDYIGHRLQDDFKQWYQEDSPIFEALKEGTFRTAYETMNDLPYPWLKNFAGVALFSGAEKVGMLGIGNYPTHEERLDAQMFVRINPLLVTTGNTIKAWNNHQKLKAEQTEHLKKKRESEHISQDLKKLLAYAAAPVFCIDVRKLITYWNHSARHMTGLSQSAVEGIMYVFRLVAKEDHHRLEHALKEAFADRTLGDLKLRIKTTTGYEQVLCSFSPKHNADGDIVGAWVIAQNIMAQADYQERLEQQVKSKTSRLQQVIYSHEQTLSELKQITHQHQESSDLQHRFAALASHEFRGPLSAIQMTAENLESHFEHFTREDIFRKIGRIRQRAHQLHNQAHDILLLTQLDSDGIRFHPVVCDVEELCLNIAEQIMIQTQHTHAIEVHLSAIHARLDSRLVTLILSNLLDNAIKYSPEAEQVHLFLRQEDDLLIFEIHDTGMGILSEESTEIFKPFYRSPRVVTSTHGSGLGLEIVQRSLRLHKGEIELISSPAGSVFKVMIPYRSL
jgi:PAS domain S-box-containing protein